MNRASQNLHHDMDTSTDHAEEHCKKLRVPDHCLIFVYKKGMSTLSSAFILMLMHFLSLNAPGFWNLDKQREIMHLAQGKNNEVLFLQECNFSFTSRCFLVKVAFFS